MACHVASEVASLCLLGEGVEPEVDVHGQDEVRDEPHDVQVVDEHKELGESLPVTSCHCNLIRRNGISGSSEITILITRCDLEKKHYRFQTL